MGGLSAAQQLIAAKSAEKAQEERMDAERAAKRDAIKKQQEAARNAPRPVTALSQALGAFDAEISQSDMLTRKTSASSSATLSRRARQKKDKARERAEGYDGKRSAKSSRDSKRSQRKEKYKHVY